jgi:hypothetical protein
MRQQARPGPQQPQTVATLGEPWWTTLSGDHPYSLGIRYGPTQIDLVYVSRPRRESAEIADANDVAELPLFTRLPGRTGNRTMTFDIR